MDAGSATGNGAGRCRCDEFVPVTEAAALAAGRWAGRGDGWAADAAASEAVISALAGLPIEGTVVVGESESEQGPFLRTGDRVGAAGGRRCDLAVDALECRDGVAWGQGGAMSVLAVGAPGAIMSAPDMYMQKLAVGASAAGSIDIEAPIADNLRAIASAYGLGVEEISVIILDRPRHEDLIAEVRKAGARIKLIPDGDITASITAAVRGTGHHAYVGIGGAREGVVTAAALRCLGGEIQVKMWPLSRREIERAREHGIEDIEARLVTADMVKGDVIFSATGVTTGEVLKGVSFFHEGARTQTLLMCTRCRVVRFVDTIHLFSDDRREILL
jgi:fructose-1,6-bisphosphatase II